MVKHSILLLVSFGDKPNKCTHNQEVAYNCHYYIQSLHFLFSFLHLRVKQYFWLQAYHHLFGIACLVVVCCYILHVVHCHDGCLVAFGNIVAREGIQLQSR